LGATEDDYVGTGSAIHGDDERSARDAFISAATVTTNQPFMVTEYRRA
jgi:hypothetical protein